MGDKVYEVEAREVGRLRNLKTFVSVRQPPALNPPLSSQLLRPVDSTQFCVGTNCPRPSRSMRLCPMWLSNDYHDLLWCGDSKEKQPQN